MSRPPVYAAADILDLAAEVAGALALVAIRLVRP
jgi:hypothetical protein